MDQPRDDQLKAPARSNYAVTGFGVRHPVPANLLMIAIMSLGVIFGLTLRREFFPEIRPNRAAVTAIYPGASPDEVEEGLILKIEDAVAEIDEVEEIVSTAAEGVGTVMIEFHRSVEDIDAAVNEVKTAVDALTDLPEEAERIIVSKFEPELPVVLLTLYGARGDSGEAAMKRAIREMKDDLRSLPGITSVSIGGFRTDEIRIEIPPENLLKYGLSLPDVADAVNAWMREVPGGSVRTGEQTVRVRTMGVEERAQTVREIPVVATSDGEIVRLGDLAEVTEGFEDVDVQSRLNGEPSVTLVALTGDDGDAIEIANLVKAYVAGLTGQPFEPGWRDRFYALLGSDDGASGLKTQRQRAYELGASRDTPIPGRIAVHNNLARFIEGRLELLARNAFWGAVLVFLTLLALLNVRVALWVMLGLVVAMLGTLAFMKLMGVTLNLLTMFGLIIVLGLLVDDAIVIAENIVAHYDAGEPAVQAAITGAGQIAWPVVATVTTTIVAFLPLSLVEGEIGDFLGALPIVVACALSVSLAEAIFILPAHMAHSLRQSETRRPRLVGRALHWYEIRRDQLINDRIIPWFGRVLGVLIEYRYITAATALAVWLGSMGMVAGHRVPFVFFPETDSEFFVVDLRMPVGTAVERTAEVIERIEHVAMAQPEVLWVEAYVGVRFDTTDWNPSAPQTHLGQLTIELVPVEERERTSAQVIASLKEQLGPMPEVQSIRFEEVQGGPGGQAINLAIRGDDPVVILAAAERLKSKLTEFEGVSEIADDADRGQRELRIHLRDGGATLGLTAGDVARQIRGAVFGLEAHSFARAEEDVDVRVMLDDVSRRRLDRIEGLYIFTPTGARVPLVEVARLEETTGYATIHRLDQKRAVTVVADVDQNLNNPERIVAEIGPFLRDLEREFPGIRIEPRGRQLENARSLSSLREGLLLACVLIYVILAWLFASYWQPLAVMLAIPFSMIGVVWGHWLAGHALMILSLIGFVALTGIVVNDSLILVEFYNEKRAQGLSVHDALVEAGQRRLRPIVLTTLTTVLGLLPLMLEQSFQARFLIPMAVAISFGLMSATLLILVVLPCLIVIGHDVGAVIVWLWTGRRWRGARDLPGGPGADRLGTRQNLG